VGSSCLPVAEQVGKVQREPWSACGGRGLSKVLVQAKLARAVLAAELHLNVSRARVAHTCEWLSS
jgi:hypothetical protein